MTPPPGDNTTVENDSEVKNTGVGALLRASRMRLGEELPDVAVVLRIRYPYLEAIENGNFEDLPGATYVVGFIRAYADHLGLDSEEVVRRYKAESADGGRAEELRFPTPVPETGIPGGAIVFIGIVVAVLAYGGWYVSTTKDGYFTDIIAPIPDRLTGFLDTPKSEESTPEAAPGAVPEMTKETDTSSMGSPSEDISSEDIAEPSAALEPQSPLPETAPADMTPVAETEPTPSPEPAVLSTDVQAPPVEEQEPAQSTEAVQKNLEDTSAAAPPPSSAVEPQSPPTEPVVKKIIEPVKVVAEAPKPVTPKPVTEEVVSTPKAPEPELPVVATPDPEPAAPQVAPLAEPKEPVIDIKAPKVVASVPKPEPKPVSEPVKVEDILEPAAEKLAVPEESETENTEATSGEQASDRSGSGVKIIINATGDSWIQVRDDTSDELLVTRLLQAGDHYEVPDRSGLRLLTGNAGALSITVDGEVVPSIGGAGIVRRGVVLDGERLRSGTAIGQ